MLKKDNISYKIDEYLNKIQKWQQELKQLRAIALECGLTEELKWGQPCYTFQGKNVVLLHGFKEYCALLFFKGALLSDEDHILIRQTENVQSARQIRFAHLKEIEKQAFLLKKYIRAAVDIEKSGLKVIFKKISEFDISEEFQKKLNEIPSLKKAFNALTPGKQKAYVLHFSSAKQLKTREARIEKCIPKILKGEDLHEKYKHKN